MAGTIDTGNYTLGGAQLYFETTIAHASLLIATEFAKTSRSLGNITTAGITPEITYVDHIVTKKGKQVKDKTAAGMSGLRVNFTFDEMNSTNLGRFFMGSVSAGKVNVLSSVLDEGSGMLVMTTDVGRDMVYRIPKCTIKPDGELALPGDSWHTAPMLIEVLEYQNADTANTTLNATWNALNTIAPMLRNLHSKLCEFSKNLIREGMAILSQAEMETSLKVQRLGMKLSLQDMLIISPRAQSILIG